MADHGLDYKVCKCGNEYFEEKQVFKIPSGIKTKRVDKQSQLPRMLLEREIIYTCTNCGNELDV